MTDSQLDGASSMLDDQSQSATNVASSVRGSQPTLTRGKALNASNKQMNQESGDQTGAPSSAAVTPSQFINPRELRLNIDSLPKVSVDYEEGEKET